MSLASAGTVDTNAGTFLIATGNISGVGSFTKTGAGTLIVTGDATNTGGTTITGGTFQIGNTGTTGPIAGDILHNAALRTEEPTSELTPLMRNSQTGFCFQ